MGFTVGGITDETITGLDSKTTKGFSRSIRSIIAKEDGKFDLRQNFFVSTSTSLIGRPINYDSRFKAIYTSMSYMQPGTVNLSEYVLPDYKKIRPQAWANKTKIIGNEIYADGILFPKRDEYKESYDLGYNYKMESYDGEIDPFYLDEIKYSSGVKLISPTVSNGFSTSISTFLTTTLKFGNSFPSNNITLFGLYSIDGRTYMELGITTSGYMTCTAFYNGSSNVAWTSTSTTYKFNTNTSYLVDFGYIGGKILLKINGSENAKFSKTCSTNTGVYFQIGSTSCVDGDVSFSLNNLSFTTDSEIIWTPSVYTTKNNFDIIGSPIISDNLISNFDVGNYIVTPNNAMDLTQRPWVLNMKLTTSSDVSTQQIIFEGRNGYFNSLRVQIYNGHFYPGYNINGSWVFLQNGSPTINPNTTYWYRVVVGDGYMNFYLSTNGIDYGLTLSKSISSYPNPNRYKIGSSESSPFLGTMDLNETYIEQNGNILWYPNRQPHITHFDTYKIREGRKEFTLTSPASVSGTLNINDGVVGGFSSSNYIYFPSNTVMLPMRMYLKFSTSSDINTLQNILNKSNFLEIIVQSGILRDWSSGSGTRDICFLKPNTTYYLKVDITQTRRHYYISETAHDEYTTERVITSNISLGTTMMKFGNHISNNNYFRGLIDFKETWFENLNTNEVIWKPYAIVYHDTNAYGLCTKDFVYTGQEMTLNAYKITYDDNTYEILLGEREPTDNNITSVELIKSGITIGDNNDYTFVYDSNKEEFVISNGSIITFNVKPSISTISVSSDTFVVEKDSNSFIVGKQTQIEYSVSCENYQTISNTISISGNTTINIELEPNDGYIEVGEYRTTLSNDAVVLENYTGNKTDIVIPNI